MNSISSINSVTVPGVTPKAPAGPALAPAAKNGGGDSDGDSDGSAATVPSSPSLGNNLNITT